MMKPLHDFPRPPFLILRQKLREQARIAIGTEDIQGIELLQVLRITSNIINAAMENQTRGTGISGQRWDILFPLLADESMGSSQGLNPTVFSHLLFVSKNTVSSLLSGLEEQGLILREMDPKDWRGFRIKLTDKGRSLTQEMIPARLTYLNDLSGELTKTEQAQLTRLLVKLIRKTVIKERILSKFRRGINEEEN